MHRRWMSPKTIRLVCMLNKVDFLSKVRFTCNVCNRPIRHAFDSPSHNANVLEEKRIAGGGYRKNEQCPFCLANDRLRFTVEVLRKHTDVLTKPCKVLEFAPIKGMELFLKANARCEYVSGDIVPKRAQLVLDITNIALPDATFDYIVCCHVLEHIPDERAALAELTRVLKPNGVLLLSVPISLALPETFEDPSNDTPDKRLAAYGQDDHVRLYGRDFADRLRGYGLTVTQIVAQEDMPEAVARYGLIPTDHNFLCKRG